MTGARGSREVAAQGRRRGNGRGRIVAWMLGATALSLALLIIGASFVMRAANHDTVQAELVQEAGEIQRFAAEGIDPATGAPFKDATRFLEVFLARQESGRGQLMVGLAPTGQLGQKRGPQTRAWTELPPAIRDRIQASGSQGRDTFPEIGTLSWSNHQVSVGASTGHIVQVRFHEPLDHDLRQQLMALVALAAAALLITGMATWTVAGRALEPLHRFEQEAARVAAAGGAARMREQGSGDYLRLARAGNLVLERADHALAQEQQFSEDLTQGIRTPLAIIRGVLEDAVAHGDHTLHPSLDEVNRLERAVSSLVLLNRAGRAEFVVARPVAADEVVRAMVVRWTRALGPQSQPLVVLDQLAAATVDVDVQRFERALDELMSNAVEACRDQGHVQVSSRIDGDNLVIEVADDGIGIPEGEHELVFARFARASNARPAPVDPAAGTGLGLSVARAVVEAHGGRLELQSRAAGGTRAVVTLPCPPLGVLG